MKNLFTVIIAALLFFSCSKENSYEIKNENEAEPEEMYRQFAVTPETFVSTSKFLKREITSLVTNPNIRYVRMFTYDQINRCTLIQIGTIDSLSATPAFQLTQSLNFNYDGSSILPYSLSSVRTVFPNLVTEFYFKYNNQGYKIMDSVRVKNMMGEPADRQIFYEYGKLSVSSKPLLTGFPMNNVSYDTLSLLYGGNIRRLTSKRVNTNGDVLVVYDFTYDDKISPYNKLNIANSLYFENSAIGLGYNVPLETHYLGVTLNNMLSWSTGNFVVTFNYAYNGDGYPIKKEMFLPGSVDADKVVHFEYY